MRLDLTKAALEAARKSDTGFDHDRTKTVGASEIGGCIKQTAMKKQGVKPDPDHVDDPGFAMRGNIIEDNWALPVLQHVASDAKAELLWAGQADQETFIWDKKYASCTPDGLLSGVPKTFLSGLGVKRSSKDVLCEIKSIDPRISPDNLPKGGHAEQAHYGMGIVRAMGEHRPDYALLLYFNCSKLTDMWPFVVAFNEDYFRLQLRRAKKAITTPWQKLPAEGKLMSGKPCQYCAFQRTCTGTRKAYSGDSRVPKTTLIKPGEKKAAKT